MILALVLVGCGSFQPSKPVTIYATLLPTPTLVVNTNPIGYEYFAEEIRWPITVNVEGQEKTFIYVAELTAYFTRIFNDEKIQKFVSIDESELSFTPTGVKVANGIMWFDLICMHPACDTAAFLITEIN